MIETIWFQNYGPFERAELALGPLTVIIGPNASGKTIALESLYRLQATEQTRARVRDLLSLMSRKGSPRQDVELGLRHSDGLQLAWTLEPTTLPDSVPPTTVLIQLQPEALRRPSFLDSDRPFMKEDGYGLATSLVELKVDDSDAFASILDKTRRIVPTFENLRFNRTRVETSGTQSVYGHELIFDMKGAADLRPSSVSDGTMLTLGLLTLTMEYAKKASEASDSTLFLIDELERGLHPRALMELVNQLRRLTEEAEVQILATSHSPYLVDCLKPEEIRVTGLHDDGTATICELTDHPDFERWKAEMSPGEFWSAVGEGWVR